MRPPAHDEVCFHCQQAAEKFFKALLQEWGLPIPKIHELDDLLTMLMPRDPTLQIVRHGLRGLSRFAIDYRYPGFHANLRKAKSAQQWAERIRLVVRTRLGLRTKS
jgi:HEPN domain-containing protein